MASTAAEKAQIMADYRRAPGDTGSPEVQIALLTNRINQLTDHFNPTLKTTILVVVY